MKKQLKWICLFLAVIFLLTSATSLVGAEIAQAETITLRPDVSDGISLLATDMNVRAERQQGMITFLETKQLIFTAVFGEGWSYSEEYSVFFPNASARTHITANADGGRTFTFDCVNGESIPESDFVGVGIYAVAASLPKLEVNLSQPIDTVGKDEWVTASFNLTLGTKQFSSGNYSGNGFIKGRGNTSWGQPKKPYSIKLESKASLLDIPMTKKYAIVPSYSDQSLMRNFITYKAGLMLDGIEYTPKCEYVEVYLNGSYNGIYLLVERVDIESTKIDIAEATAEDLTGGYLIEKDIANKIDFGSDLWFDCPYWANPDQDYFVLKTPESDDPNLAQQMLNYLENHMQQLHNSIMHISNESYTRYVDVDSWIDFILMQEITKNIDGNLKTSCYMYKQSNDDHIYMTALWDFDLAFGNANWDNASEGHNDCFDCPSGIGTGGFMAINSSSPWFDTLYDEYPEFHDALISKYNEYRHTIIPAMLAMINEQGAYLSANTDRNDAMWYTNFSQGVDTLKDWMNGRIAWLDSQWNYDYEAIDLDQAMNAIGGSLHFSTEGEEYPFIGGTIDGKTVGMSSIESMNDSTSGVALTLDMLAGETLSFEYRVSCEDGYDEFRFLVNGTTENAASGEIAWQTYTYTAPSDGSYIFRWEYAKDSSVGAGSDCVWVDNVSYSGAGISYTPGDVDMDGSVTISDATLIMRNALGLIHLNAQQIALADLDGDGEITITDATLTMRNAMNL